MAFFVGLRSVAANSRVLARSTVSSSRIHVSRGPALVARVSGGASRYAQIPPSLDEVEIEYPGERSASPAAAPKASSSPTASTFASTTPLPTPPPFLESLSGDSDPLATDWSKSYHGLSSEPFSAEISNILQAPLDPEDVEMKPGTRHPPFTYIILFPHV